MPDSRRIIVRPLVTEKSVAQTTRRQYSFAVRKDAAKQHIKAAVEDIFKVTVLRVNTIMVHGNLKRDMRRRSIKPTLQRPDWKKAIVTLKEGDKIELGGVAYFES